MATGSEEKQDEHITFSSAWCFFCPPIKSLGKSAYRYIRVKILAGWGKILETMPFGKIKPFWGRICTTYERFIGIN